MRFGLLRVVLTALGLLFFPAHAQAALRPALSSFHERSETFSEKARRDETPRHALRLCPRPEAPVPRAELRSPATNVFEQHTQAAQAPVKKHVGWFTRFFRKHVAAASTTPDHDSVVEGPDDGDDESLDAPHRDPLGEDDAPFGVIFPRTILALAPLRLPFARVANGGPRADHRLRSVRPG